MAWKPLLMMMVSTENLLPLFIELHMNLAQVSKELNEKTSKELVELSAQLWPLEWEQPQEKSQQGPGNWLHVHVNK